MKASCSELKQIKFCRLFTNKDALCPKQAEEFELPKPIVRLCCQYSMYRPCGCQ